jgi:hypothetical protein
MFAAGIAYFFPASGFLTKTPVSNLSTKRITIRRERGQSIFQK